MEAKKIKSEFNFEDPNIKSNVCYGFLDKKKKKNLLIDSSQKRWLFIISSRPLNDNDYETKENYLDASVLPWWLKFDTLYYYIFEDNDDQSEAKGTIEIRYIFIFYYSSESNGVEIYDENDIFYLKLDMGDRIFTFSSEFKYEREKWYEALKNSRRTTKEIKHSISKKPKNVAKLVNVFEKEGESKIKEIVNYKKEECLKCFTKM